MQIHTAEKFPATDGRAPVNSMNTHEEPHKKLGEVPELLGPRHPYSRVGDPNEYHPILKCVLREL